MKSTVTSLGDVVAVEENLELKLLGSDDINSQLMVIGHLLMELRDSATDNSLHEIEAEVTRVGDSLEAEIARTTDALEEITDALKSISQKLDEINFTLDMNS